jgi:hypothetical protein
MQNDTAVPGGRKREVFGIVRPGAGTTRGSRAGTTVRLVVRLGERRKVRTDVVAKGFFYEAGLRVSAGKREGRKGVTKYGSASRSPSGRWPLESRVTEVSSVSTLFLTSGVCTVSWVRVWETGGMSTVRKCHVAYWTVTAMVSVPATMSIKDSSTSSSNGVL